MVRCGLCMVWLHHKCVSNSQEGIDLQGAWTCQRCRRVPVDVATILCKVRDLQASVDSGHHKRSKLHWLIFRKLTLIL